MKPDPNIAVCLTPDVQLLGEVYAESLRAVADILRTTPEDISELRYLKSGVMLMSGRAQGDETVYENKDAMFLFSKFEQRAVLVRGDVVCFPRGVPWMSANQQQEHG